MGFQKLHYKIKVSQKEKCLSSRNDTSKSFPDKLTMYVFAGVISEITCFVSEVSLDKSASISTCFHLHAQLYTCINKSQCNRKETKTVNGIQLKKISSTKRNSQCEKGYPTKCQWYRLLLMQ